VTARLVDLLLRNLRQLLLLRDLIPQHLCTKGQEIREK
jgi:hypothetical protein